MIDIIVLSWILWGGYFGRRTPLLFLVGDLAAVSAVVILYSALNTIALDIMTLVGYKEAMIRFYLWLEPLQTVQLQGDAIEYIIVELYAYALLIIFLLAAMAVMRNTISAFYDGGIRGTMTNIYLGYLRNIAVIAVAFIFVPAPLVQTYWYQEFFRDTVIMMIIQ